MGSLPGAVLGALLLGVAEALTPDLHLAAWATAVPYVVIFVVLLVRPQGLLGARLREDVAAMTAAAELPAGSRVATSRRGRSRAAGARRRLLLPSRSSPTTSTTRT